MSNIVTICGSMRFFLHMLEVAQEETRDGAIVLAPFAVIAPNDQDSDVKVMLDELHRQKIAMSDRVLVVSDPTGYYGASTRAEIAYAEDLGLPVTLCTVYLLDGAVTAADRRGHES